MIGGIGLILGLLGLGGLAIKSVIKDAASKPIQVNSVPKKKEWDMNRQLLLQRCWLSDLNILNYPSNPWYKCCSWRPEEILESGRFIMYEEDLSLLKEVLPQPYYDIYKYYGIDFGLSCNDKFALALAQMQMLREDYAPPQYFYELTPIEPFIEKLIKEYPQEKINEMIKKIKLEKELDRYFFMPELSPFTPECMAECIKSLGRDYIMLEPLDYAFLRWKMLQPPTYGIEDPMKRYSYGKYRFNDANVDLLRVAAKRAYMYKDKFWLRPEHLKPEYRDMYEELIPPEPK